jgi:hypothetical protein
MNTGFLHALRTPFAIAPSSEPTFPARISHVPDVPPPDVPTEPPPVPIHPPIPAEQPPIQEPPPEPGRIVVAHA